MPRYIDANALYERTAEWEASALEYVEKLKRTPLEEMDADEMDEWRRWTAILGERSAFKHDVADAPTADVVEIKKEGEWEMFDLISSAYYGKGMYFKEDNGIVYSRYSHKHMSVDEAIREFVSLIDDSEWERRTDDDRA